MANPLAMREEDIKLLLTANVHVGTKNCDPQMERYVWRRRGDGVHILNLGKTWEKLMLAARVIVAIENPQDVVVCSSRPYGQRAVFKFAQHTGAQYIAGRYTPGTFTNHTTKVYLEPRLLVVTDPLTDHQPVLEASYVNIPVIAFVDTDSATRNVDIAIPCNNKGKQAIGLLYWLLSREVNRMRGVCSRSEPWNVSVDLFIYRDPEEAEKQAADAQPEPAATQHEAVLEDNDYTGPVGDKQEWGAEQWDGQGAAPDWQHQQAAVAGAGAGAAAPAGFASS